MAWDFTDNAPIYMQIVNGLQREIASGAYAPGTRLPSVRDLAMEAGVNPNTMQRALAELERRGLVNAQRTAGRFVTEDTAALSEMRRSLSETIVADFYRKMRGLGLSDEEIISVVRAWIRENTADISTGGVQPAAAKTASGVQSPAAITDAGALTTSANAAAGVQSPAIFSSQGGDLK